jgi:energy-coupling factor transport system permease protein
VLLGGLGIATIGMVFGGRRVTRTRYRPDRWRGAEVAVAACGIGAGALLFLTVRVDPNALYPSLSPLTWPELTLLPAVAVLLAAAPALVAPDDRVTA